MSTYTANNLLADGFFIDTLAQHCVDGSLSDPRILDSLMSPWRGEIDVFLTTIPGVTILGFNNGAGGIIEVYYNSPARWIMVICDPDSPSLQEIPLPLPATRNAMADIVANNSPYVVVEDHTGQRVAFVSSVLHSDDLDDPFGT